MIGTYLVFVIAAGIPTAFILILHHFLKHTEDDLKQPSKPAPSARAEAPGHPRELAHAR
jgi:hypothetical protein